MLNKLVCIGGGGHCLSVLDSVLRMNFFSDIVITDLVIPRGTNLLGCQVVGTDDRLKELFDKGYQYAFITIGSIQSTAMRRKLAEVARGIGFKITTIIDPLAEISESARISEGVFVGKRVVVNAEARIDEFAIINTGTILEHGCEIGAFSHVAVGTVICGDVKIGGDVFIGANTTIIQGVEIGMGSVVGAGALLNKSVPKYCTAVGVPAKIIKQK